MVDCYKDTCYCKHNSKSYYIINTQNINKGVNQVYQRFNKSFPSSEYPMSRIIKIPNDMIFNNGFERSLLKIVITDTYQDLHFRTKFIAMSQILLSIRISLEISYDVNGYDILRDYTFKFNITNTGKRVIHYIDKIEESLLKFQRKQRSTNIRYRFTEDIMITENDVISFHANIRNMDKSNNKLITPSDINFIFNVHEAFK